MNTKNFGLVMTSFPSARPSVRNPTMLMRPCFVWREVAWRDEFTTEMLKNTKYKVNLYVFVDKRRKKRKREKKEKKKKRRRLRAHAAS